MADTQILPTGTLSTPGDYVLPASQVLTLGAVHAHYDGSGAAGDYVPTLDIISDSGHVILSVPHDTTITAGSNAEASWAPFLKTQPKAATANNFRTWWEGEIADDGTGGVHNVPTGADTLLTGSRTTGPQPLDASFPITFDSTVGARNVIRLSVNPSPPAGQGANAYFFRFSLNWPGVPADYRYIRLGFSTPGSGFIELDDILSVTVRQPKNETSRSQYQELTCIVPPFVFNAADYVDVSPYAYQESGVNQAPHWTLEVYSVQTA